MITWRNGGIAITVVSVTPRNAGQLFVLADPHPIF
jgi:hypothetical protein